MIDDDDSRLDRGIQSATEMLPLKRGARVLHIIVTAPASPDMRLADALVNILSSVESTMIFAYYDVLMT